jgi:hypothetical protein
VYGIQQITSLPYRLKPSTTYTLTYYIRKAGSYQATIQVFNTFWGTNALSASPVLATGLARYTNTFNTIAGSNITYIIVFNAGGQSGAGTWADFDGWQLEEGSTATDYAPMSPIEFGFMNSVTNIGNVFYDTQAPNLPVIFYNDTASSSNVNLGYRVFDGLNNMVKSGTNAIAVPSGRSTNYLDVSLTTNKLGAFRTLAWIVGQADTLTEAVSSTVVVEANLSEALSKFGTHPAFFVDYLSPIKKLGFKFVRTLSPGQQFRWTAAEGVSNVFVFFDSQINAATNLGLTVVATLGEEVVNTPAYAISGGYPVIADWKYFVTNIVQHYTNQVHVWEIWNEPEAEGGLGGSGPTSPGVVRYAEILTNAANVIRGFQGSGATVIGMVTAYSNYMAWVAANLYDYSSFDVVGTHLYPEIGDEFINRNTAIATGTFMKPQWNTEEGGRTDPYHQSWWWEDNFIDADDPNATRDYKIRGSWGLWDFVETSTMGVGGIVKQFWYDARHTGNVYDNVINYSPFDYDHTIKPLGVFYSTLARFADGGENGPLWRPGSGVSGRVFKMRDGTNSLLICYKYSVNAGGGPTNLMNLTTSLSTSDCAFFNAYGNPITYNAGVSFGEVPIFMIATNTATNTLFSSLSVSAINDTNKPNVSFVIWPTAATNEGGWVKWFAQDDIAVIPRFLGELANINATNEIAYAYNIAGTWSGWSGSNSVQVVSGYRTIYVAAKDQAGNAMTNSITLGEAPAQGTNSITAATINVQNLIITGP